MYDIPSMHKIQNTAETFTTANLVFNFVPFFVRMVNKSIALGSFRCDCIVTTCKCDTDSECTMAVTGLSLFI